jgi:type IV pilus assembly protein PilW
MNTSPGHNSCARYQRGFSLVEMMVTVSIALLLLFGLVTVVQNIRKASVNQQSLVQLQDEQRFAMTVITDVIQAGGYYPDPTADTADTALPVDGVWLSSEGFYGTPIGGANSSASISVRYMTTGGDGVILCDGSSNTATPGTNTVYINQFTVQPSAPGVPGGLYCQVNNGGPSAAAPGVLLAAGVQSLNVWYGVKRNCASDDYNVDTYITADQMSTTTCEGNDWDNISSVRVQLVFTNPLNGQPGQPATITFQRVVEVMGRAGVHT